MTTVSGTTPPPVVKAQCTHCRHFTATPIERFVLALLTDDDAMTRAAMQIDAYVPLTAGNYEAGRRAFSDALCAAAGVTAHGADAGKVEREWTVRVERNGFTRDVEVSAVDREDAIAGALEIHPGSTIYGYWRTTDAA